MSTYSDHDQRLLDQQSGADLDRQAERREAKASKDESDFNVWWDRVNRESFLVAYGPGVPYRDSWGAGHRGYALMGWMARAEHVETTCDGATPVRASTAEVVLPKTAESTASPVHPRAIDLLNEMVNLAEIGDADDDESWHAVLEEARALIAQSPPKTTSPHIEKQDPLT